MEQNQPKTGELTNLPITQYGEVAKNYVDNLPEKVRSFVADYKQLLLLLLLIISAWIAVQLTIAILGAIEGVPFLSPIMELVGLGYSGWFIYRYLLWTETRQELVNDFNAIKSKFLGGN